MRTVGYGGRVREKGEGEGRKWRRKGEMMRVEVRGRKGEKERGDKKSMIGRGKERGGGKEGRERKWKGKE